MSTTLASMEREPKVPRWTGPWVLDEVVDNGDCSYVCELCQKQDIRYEHHISNTRTGARAILGCVCVEKLIPGYYGADIEREISNTLKRRANLRIDWKRTRKGNLIGKPRAKGLPARYTVVQSKYNSYAYVVNGEWGKWHRTEREAQDDALEHARSQINPNRYAHLIRIRESRSNGGAR